jgi:Ni,Fe-hydrogenase I cytochrome b subunit
MSHVTGDLYSCTKLNEGHPIGAHFGEIESHYGSPPRDYKRACVPRRGSERRGNPKTSVAVLSFILTRIHIIHIRNNMKQHTVIRQKESSQYSRPILILHYIHLSCKRKKFCGEDAVTHVRKMTYIWVSLFPASVPLQLVESHCEDAHITPTIQRVRFSTFGTEELRKCILSWKAIHLGKIRMLMRA